MTGWECPRCYRIWAPFVQGCVTCNTPAVVQDNSSSPVWLRPSGSDAIVPAPPEHLSGVNE